MASRHTSRNKSGLSLPKKEKKVKKKQQKVVVQGPPGAEGKSFTVDEDSILCGEDGVRQHQSKGSNPKNGKVLRGPPSFEEPALRPELSDEQEGENDSGTLENNENGHQNAIPHDIGLQQNGVGLPRYEKPMMELQGVRPKTVKPVLGGCEMEDTSEVTTVAETPLGLDLVGPEQGVFGNGAFSPYLVSSDSKDRHQKELKVNGHVKRAPLILETTDLETDQSDGEDVTKVNSIAVSDLCRALPTEVSLETEPPNSEKERKRTKMKRSKDRSNGLHGRKDDPDKDYDTTEIQNSRHMPLLKPEDFQLEDFETFLAIDSKSSDSSSRPTGQNPGDLLREPPNGEDANEYPEMPHLELNEDDEDDDGTIYASIPQFREQAMGDVHTLHDSTPLQPNHDWGLCEEGYTLPSDRETPAAEEVEAQATSFSLCQVSDFMECPSEQELQIGLDFSGVDHNMLMDDDCEDPSYPQMLHRGMSSRIVGFDGQGEEVLPLPANFQEPQSEQQPVYGTLEDLAWEDQTDPYNLAQEHYSEDAEEITQESLYKIFAKTVKLDDESGPPSVPTEEHADNTPVSGFRGRQRRQPEAGDTFEGLFSLQGNEARFSAPVQEYPEELPSSFHVPPPRKPRSKYLDRQVPEHESCRRNHGGNTRDIQRDPAQSPYVRLEEKESGRDLGRRPGRVESDGFDLHPVSIHGGDEFRRLTQEEEDLQSLSSVLSSGRRLYRERMQSPEVEELEVDLQSDFIIAVQEQDDEYGRALQPGTGQLGAGFDNKTRELCDMELALQLQIEENEREANKQSRPPRQPYNRLRQRAFHFGTRIPDTEPRFQSRFSLRQQQSMGLFGGLQPFQPSLARRYPFQTRRRSSEENVEDLLPEGLSDYNDFDPNDYEALLELEEKLGDVVHPGLSRTEIELLPVSLYDNSTVGATDPVGAEAFSEEQTCKICMCDYEKGESLRGMPCCHRFHQECIDEWLTRNGVCPVCRVKVRDEIPRT